MARKEKKTNRWLETDRVGSVTLYRTARSPYWWMYWTETITSGDGSKANGRPRESIKSTRETDLRLARVIAGQKNEDLFAQQRYPELEQGEEKAVPLRPVIRDFVAYLEELGRSQEYIRKVKSHLTKLADWMQGRRLSKLQDISPAVLKRFSIHLREQRQLSNASVNHYVTSVHNFYGYAAFKRQLADGPNPAKTGRQAVLDKLPTRRIPPPTIYPDQINAVIEKAREAGDHQIVNLIVFICEGGFRFQELQFLQVGDINMPQREIVLDTKRPDLTRVRDELQRRCLTPEGYWMPKSAAGRRVVHITDRLTKVIGTMGLGEVVDWVFMNQAGKQVAGNKTLMRLKKYALEAGVLVEPHPKTGEPCSLLRWHWLRHYHRTRAHVSKIRREVSKLAMGHAADGIHDHYRGVDPFAFHEEYAKFDSGLNDDLIGTC
ncbi:MAG: tyrosine-type recombinase/integrase [Phycisphaerae bacterium]